MSDGDNPNPQRITTESWDFMAALLAMEPDTENSGIWTDKPGYHGTRDENAARDAKDGDTDYSRQHPLDLLGPGDKGAAYDWTHRAAQRGDYRSMAKYGDRLERAFNARDPRLYGWKEAQGQTDVDATPEELDFGTWTRHTPSASHAWHWHLSERRAFVANWDNKTCMLSILRGETLTAYLARGGRLVNKGADMDQKEPLIAKTGLAGRTVGDALGDLSNLRNALIDDKSAVVIGSDEYPKPGSILGRLLAAAERPPAELSDADLDTLAEKVTAKLAALIPTKEQIAKAVTDEIGT